MCSILNILGALDVGDLDGGFLKAALYKVKQYNNLVTYCPLSSGREERSNVQNFSCTLRRQAGTALGSCVKMVTWINFPNSGFRHTIQLRGKPKGGLHSSFNIFGDNYYRLDSYLARLLLSTYKEHTTKYTYTVQYEPQVPNVIEELQGYRRGEN